MNDLLGRLQKLSGYLHDECRDWYADQVDEAAARIRELEAEVEALQPDRIGDWVNRSVVEAAGTEVRADIIALIEAAKKLPMTADGVRVGLDDIVYDDGHDCVVCGWSQWDSMNQQWSTEYVAHAVNGVPYTVDVDCCYSTREAAEKARGA